MLNIKFGAKLVKLMLPGRFTLTQGEQSVGELFAIVRQYLGDFDRACVCKLLKETAGIGRGFGRHDPNEHPARGSVNGDKQISILRLNAGTRVRTPSTPSSTVNHASD